MLSPAPAACTATRSALCALHSAGWHCGRLYVSLYFQSHSSVCLYTFSHIRAGFEWLTRIWTGWGAAAPAGAHRGALHPRPAALPGPGPRPGPGLALGCQCRAGVAQGAGVIRVAAPRPAQQPEPPEGASESSESDMDWPGSGSTPSPGARPRTWKRAQL